MNTFGLVLLAVGVLVALIGVMIAATGRPARGDTQPVDRSDWAAYDQGPDPAVDHGGDGRPRSRRTTTVGLAMLTVGLVVALAGGVVWALPGTGGSADTAAWESGAPPNAERTEASATATAPTTSRRDEPGDDEPRRGPGTECGLVQPTYGEPAQVRIERGTIGCAEAERVVQKYYDLPADPNGGNTAPKEFDGWRCTTATAGAAGERGYGTSCLKGDVQLVVPNSMDSGSPQRDSGLSEGGSRPYGDLGLAIPMTRPSCDGRGIVVLYSAVLPGAYESEIRTALASNPGARYLRTDQACPSLRQRDENGNVIYAVYRESGYSRAELCADVVTAPAGAYGRWLDTTSDPTVLVSC
ncbi:hypothetical protein [Dietzia sp. SLG310A2-38A2]|uniref:hypothetical protein n=1 Tax=Dietzia sp. SLG310A2-38A2 TaxID=1630643 RepID=UPI001F506BA3|nr:hypothetical protein [Dietzia sp. SLG310A2-38A2]